MTALAGSRYADQPVLQVMGSDGSYRPTVYGPAPFINSAFYHHVISLGDRMDLLAEQYLGDPTLWWQIADANPQITYPDIALLPPGISRIPIP